MFFRTVVILRRRIVRPRTFGLYHYYLYYDSLNRDTRSDNTLSID